MHTKKYDVYDVLQLTLKPTCSSCSITLNFTSSADFSMEFLHLIFFSENIHFRMYILTFSHPKWFKCSDVAKLCEYRWKYIDVKYVYVHISTVWDLWINSEGKIMITNYEWIYIPIVYTRWKITRKCVIWWFL